MNIQFDIPKPSFLTYFLNTFFKNQTKSSTQNKESNDRNQEYKKLFTGPKQTPQKPNIDYKGQKKKYIIGLSQQR